MYKSGIGDFPLKDYPCEHWWVRYAVSCTYLQKQFEKIWEKRIEELKQKRGFTSFSSRGFFNVRRIRSEKSAKIFLESKIWIQLKDNTEKEVNPIKNKEIWNVLRKYLSEIEIVGWGHCPYQEDFQSKCPFYEPSEFYKDKPLEELRTHKGHELR